MHGPRSCTPQPLTHKCKSGETVDTNRKSQPYDARHSIDITLSVEMLPQHIQKHEHLTPSLHAWAGISFNGKTELAFLDANVTANTYSDLL